MGTPTYTWYLVGAYFVQDYKIYKSRWKMEETHGFYATKTMCFGGEFGMADLMDKTCQKKR